MGILHNPFNCIEIKAVYSINQSVSFKIKWQKSSLAKSYGILKDRRQLRAQWEHLMHCKTCCKIFLIKFRQHLSCLQNLVLQHRRISWSCSRFFTLCKHKFARVLRNCRSQIASNDIKKESAANSIFITPPKNKEVLNALDTIWRRWQCEGANMDTFFH